MLRTLESMTTEQAADTLVAAMDSFLPSISDPLDSRKLYDGNVQLVLAEVKEKLGADSISEDMTTEALDLLSDEFYRVTMSKHDIESSALRVGQAGLLESYTFSFEEHSEFALTLLPKLNPDMFAETVLRPDQALHMREGVFDSNGSAVSLFTRVYSEKEPFTLYVECRRRGDLLELANYWEIYHADVDLSYTLTPLQTLFKFISKYGSSSFQLGTNRIEGLPYVLESIFEEIIDLNHRYKDYNTGRYIYGSRENDGTYVTLAYSINLSRYIRDLTRHPTTVKPVYLKIFSDRIPKTSSVKASKSASGFTQIEDKNSRISKRYRRDS